MLTCAACAGASVDNGLPDAAGDAGGRHDAGAAEGGAHPDAAGDASEPGDASVQSDAVQQDAGTCIPEPEEGLGNNTCLTAVDKGSLSDATSSQVSVIGNIWPAGDVDWYKISFVDTADTPGVCDPFRASITFAQNPGNNYRFDVVLDNCTDLPTCGTGEQTTGLTGFTYTDDFACPCVVNSGTPSATSDTVHECIDHSMTIRLRVFRVTGAPPQCENYELLLSNGPRTDGGV